MKRQLDLPSLLIGGLGGILLVLATGFSPAASPEVGRYRAHISDTGETIILVDTVNGTTWARPESGRALSSAKFQPLGGPGGK